MHWTQLWFTNFICFPKGQSAMLFFKVLLQMERKNAGKGTILRRKRDTPPPSPPLKKRSMILLHCIVALEVDPIVAQSARHEHFYSSA